MRTMLDYVKTILNKVSFDVNLFRKELMKSLGRLSQEEREELRVWTEQQYGKVYGYVINDVFKIKN